MTHPEEFVIENGVLKEYKGCGGDVVIPCGVKVIGDRAFYEKTALTSVQFPEGLQQIGKKAFRSCVKLKSVCLPHSVTRLGSGAFEDCARLEKVTLSENLEEIPRSAFALCRRLKGIVIPEGVKRVGMSAFGGCVSLFHVVFPESLQRIEAYAFKYCSALQAVSLPACLRFVGKTAFSYCTNLEQVTFAGDKVRFSHGVFSGCLLLRVYSSEGIFNALWNADGIERGEYCALSLESGAKLRRREVSFIRGNLDKIYTVLRITGKLHLFVDALERSGGISPRELDGYIKKSEGEPEFATLLLAYKKEHFPPEVLAELERIREAKELGLIPRTVPEWKKLFDYKKQGDEIVLQRYWGTESHLMIPQKIGRSKVTGISSGTFYGCEKLKSIVLPHGLTDIENRAFYNCRNLESVVFPETLERIGEAAFAQCHSLKEVFCPRVPRVGESAFSGCEGLADEKGFVIFGDVLFDYVGNDACVSVPEGISRIDRGTFRDCTCITEVEIPSTVKRIGSGAFWGCSSLKQVAFSKGLCQIGDEAFCHCTALERVCLPQGLKTVGRCAFWNCTALSRLHLPQSVKTVGQGAFGRCRALAQDGFVIFSGVLYAYVGAGGQLTVPEGVKEICRGVFSSCFSLSVRLPESMERIGDAFRRCAALTSLTLPRGMKRIEKGELSDCKNLVSLIVPGTETRIAHGALSHRELTLCAPAGSLAEQYAKENGLPFQELG